MLTRSATCTLLGLLAACRQSPVGPQPNSGAPAIHVQGNRLVDQNGHTVRLRGVDRSGAEYACAQGWGFFDGPADSAAVAAIAAWHATAVRVPLNETCWLGINGVAAQYSGNAYHQQIIAFVSRLNSAGMVVILDLHWTAADSAIALAQAPMPNRDHTPQFWRQVATTFQGNDAVLFDLFNEPYPDNNSDTPEAWRCWRDGGMCSGMTFQAAGMQELVDAVRSTGATNVIMVGGVEYASGLSHWLDNAPATRCTTSPRRGTSTTSAGAIPSPAGMAPPIPSPNTCPSSSASWDRTTADRASSIPS